MVRGKIKVLYCYIGILMCLRYIMEELWNKNKIYREKISNKMIDINFIY